MKPEELKRLRKKMGVSQEALARKMEISSRTVYRWEKGDNPIHPIFAEHIRRLDKELRGAA